MLGHRRDAGGQAARQADQDIFDGRRALVLRGEDLGMVGIELEGLLAALLLAQAEEALDRRVAVGAVLPFAGGAPFEFGGFRRLGQRIAGRRSARQRLRHSLQRQPWLSPWCPSGVVNDPERYCIAFVPINRANVAFLALFGHASAI